MTFRFEKPIVYQHAIEFAHESDAKRFPTLRTLVHEAARAGSYQP